MIEGCHIIMPKIKIELKEKFSEARNKIFNLYISTVESNIIVQVE